MLAVQTKPKFDERIVEYEYRTHAPFTSTTFNPNDEVRIAIQQQELFTYPCESFLYLHAKVTKGDGTTDDNTLKLCNNGPAFLFNEMRYELGGVTVDRVKNVGITSTIRNILCMTPDDERKMEVAGWCGVGKTSAATGFSVCLPLKMLMGFFEDYNRVIVNQKQELIILLASTFKHALNKEGAPADFADYKLVIDKLSWRMPYVRCSDEVKLSLMRVIEQDRVLQMPFRSWELHEYPELPTTDRQSWTVKTSSQLEKPRYVILALQTDRRDNFQKPDSEFDRCSIQDVKVFLNSQYYPYDSVKADSALMYQMYARFQASYYGTAKPTPLLSYVTFYSYPLFVIDCSKQVESLKSGPVDVRLEFDATAAFPAKTTAYCLIIHDSLVEYSPLTGLVTRVH